MRTKDPNGIAQKEAVNIDANMIQVVKLLASAPRVPVAMVVTTNHLPFPAMWRLKPNMDVPGGLLVALMLAKEKEANLDTVQAKALNVQAIGGVGQSGPIGESPVLVQPRRFARRASPDVNIARPALCQRPPHILSISERPAMMMTCIGWIQTEQGRTKSKNAQTIIVAPLMDVGITLVSTI